MYEREVNLLEEDIKEKEIIENIETLGDIKEKEIIKNDKKEVIIKHFSQMTNEERMYLLLLKEQTVRKNIFFSDHALQRMEERNIFESQVIKAIKVGQIINYRLNGRDEVLTIRSCHTNKAKKQVYVVYSLTRRKVITTYSKKEWLTFNKNNYMKNYEKNYSINIPESFKKKCRFLYL